MSLGSAAILIRKHNMSSDRVFPRARLRDLEAHGGWTYWVVVVSPKKMIMRLGAATCGGSCFIHLVSSILRSTVGTYLCKVL